MTFPRKTGVVSFYNDFPNGVRHTIDPDGTVSVSDPRRGIGLVCVPFDQQRHKWMVVSMFLRTDTLESGDAFTVEYGKN